MKLLYLPDRVIKYTFYFLFFLVPLVMTPFNYELFEFSKMLLVYILTIIIVAAWLTKMILCKKIFLRSTPFDFPLLLFFISQILSFVFSINRHTSFWGYYGRFHGGLLSTTAYLLLFYALVSNLDRRTTVKLLHLSLMAGFLVAVYGILERFGIDAHRWVQDVQNRVFSTLGQPNWLAAYLVILLPMAMGFALNEKLQSKIQKVFNFNMYLLSFIFYICLLFTKSRSGFLGFGITYLTFWGLVIFKRGKDFLKSFLLLSSCFLVITFLIGTPFEKINRYFSRQVLTSFYIPHTPPASLREALRAGTYHIPDTSEGGTESGEIRKIVWEGALEVARHYPVFGSGIETFAYSYYQYRPQEHNLTSEWDFLYNKAHNEYLNFLATTGMVGLGAYLFFIGSFIWWSIKRILGYCDTRILSKNLPNNFPNLNIALFSGWLSILITNFFGFSVVPVAIFFFLFPAISFSLSNSPQGWDYTYTLGVKQKFAIGVTLLVAGYCLLVAGKLWFADSAYARGRSFNQKKKYDLAFDKLSTAISLNPWEPIYKDEMSVTLSHLAVLANDQDLNILAEELVQKAILLSDQAIGVSSYNLNFWKRRAQLFRTLSAIDEQYSQKALMALKTAHMLAPTDAKIAYNYSLVLGSVGEDEKAVDILKKTIALKSNYRDARYALALFYHQANREKEAIGELEYILENIAADDEKAKEKLEEWSSALY